MKIYLGIGGDRRVHAFAERHGCGWCLTPDNHRPVPHGTYFLDNGAFVAWKNQKPWNEHKFECLLAKFPNYDFVVVPDIVCQAGQSLKRSLEYVEQLERPRYLAVQDGMLQNEVMPHLNLFDGIFIGGSISWKFSTAPLWAALARYKGIKCHAARVGTWEGMVHMHFSGVDSIDTTSPSRHQSDYHIVKYLDHLANQTQLEAVA